MSERFCKDCKWHRPFTTTVLWSTQRHTQYDKCVRPDNGVVDLVTGAGVNSDPPSCRQQREQYGPPHWCGPEGKYWTPK